jgi:hypothetical protein
MSIVFPDRLFKFDRNFDYTYFKAVWYQATHRA